MPQQILSMSSFTQNHKVIERKLFNMQLSLSKATGIISQVADKLIQAEKSNTMPDSKDLVLKSLDAIILLGHCNAEVISRRKFNVKPTLSQEVRSICENKLDDLDTPDFLFGDDFAKAIKEARETKKIADQSCRFTRSLYRRPYGQRQRGGAVDHISNLSSLEIILLERGKKTRFQRRPYYKS